MKRTKLGASALEVSDICLGTMTWGEQNSEAEAHAQIEWALAKEHGLPLAGIALAFTRNRFFTASTIIGATSLNQLDELSGYFDLVLPPAVVSGIEQINTIYPSPCAQ